MKAQAFIAKTKAGGEDYVARVRAEAVALTAAARQQAEVAKGMHDAAEAKERKAHSLFARATAEADRLRSWAGKVRSWVDGFRRSSLVDAARHAASAEVAMAKSDAANIRRQLEDERARRRDAERRAATAAAAARAVGIDRDRLRQRLSRSPEPPSPGFAPARP